MNKIVYFVTEGETDQIILEELIAQWLGGQDFISRRIQPPSSDYAEDLDSNLSKGWKGVLAWCAGQRQMGDSGRDEAIKNADCLVIHVDADVALEKDFKDPICQQPCPPESNACNWVRDELNVHFDGVIPNNVVLCVPAQDLEAWILTALHPDTADGFAPIECRLEPGALLIPHKLTRKKDGKLRKVTSEYKSKLSSIIKGWHNCTSTNPPRCPEALRFEVEARRVLEYQIRNTNNDVVISKT
jgi:hypothetical protein